MFSYVILFLSGILGGSLSGLLGIGGAIVIVPILTFVLGFNQKLAQGTSLFVLIFPLTLLPALNYYKSGNVSIKSSIFIILGFLISSYIVSKYAVSLNPLMLKKFFGVFLVCVGLLMLFK